MARLTVEFREHEPAVQVARQLGSALQGNTAEIEESEIADVLKRLGQEGYDRFRVEIAREPVAHTLSIIVPPPTPPGWSVCPRCHGVGFLPP